MTRAGYRPKIQPDASVAPLNWHTLGPGEPALGEWADGGLDLPDMDVIRTYRLSRVVEKLIEHDYGGIVLFDPLNARYATSSTNMQVWITHNASRYAFVGADGHVVQFEFSNAFYLSDPFEHIDEVRPATDWYYFAAGNTYDAKAKTWADEIAVLLREHGGGSRRLAVDRLNPEGVHHLDELGVTVHNGEEVMERALMIKHPEEVKAMRCAIAAGDLVAFDTDLIGSYGMCVDLSRTWLCGAEQPTPNQLEVFDLALEKISRSTALLRPGATFKELTFGSWIPDSDTYRHYTTQFHGVGLCDEYPAIVFPEDWEFSGYDGVVEPGMVMCVESYVGRRDGGEGVKLEEQVLITGDGPVVLSSYPMGLAMG